MQCVYLAVEFVQFESLYDVISGKKAIVLEVDGVKVKDSDEVGDEKEEDKWYCQRH